MNQTKILSPQPQRAIPARSQANAARRVDLIDMLRGLALCGILLIHVATFARPGAPPGLSYSGSPLNEFILAGLILLIEGKFFSLFAMLFGVSFALQYESAVTRGSAFVPQFRRRLLILALIGVAHILLLWEGDILLLYALVGFLLIPLRDRPSQRLLRWVLWLLGVPLVLVAIAFAGLMLAQQYPPALNRLSSAEVQFSREFAATRAAIIARYANDALFSDAGGRIMTYLGNLPLLLIRLPTVLAMFLLGFVIGRQRILHDVAQHLPLLRRACIWGLGIGFAASLLVTLAYNRLPPFAALTALGFNQVLAGPVLAIGYGATFVLVAHRSQDMVAPLAAYGRMALSMYLLQSAICGLLFYGFGFGLVLEVAPYQSLILAVLINILLIAACQPWLRHFRYGPVEWLWRSLTLGTRQPFRVRPEPALTDHRPAPAAVAATGGPDRDKGFDGQHTH